MHTASLLSTDAPLNHHQPSCVYEIDVRCRPIYSPAINALVNLESGQNYLMDSPYYRPYLHIFAKQNHSVGFTFGLRKNQAWNCGLAAWSEVKLYSADDVSIFMCERWNEREKNQCFWFNRLKSDGQPDWREEFKEMMSVYMLLLRPQSGQIKR